MKQTEIEFFWPLTQQLPLNLDYSPCELFFKEKQQYIGTITATNGSLGFIATSLNNVTLSNHYEIRKDSDSVGYWEITDGFRVYQKKKPKYYIRQSTKILLGWVWKDTQ